MGIERVRNLVPFRNGDKAALPLEVLDTVRKFLRYSFVEIDFEYDALTGAEKRLVNKEAFEQMVRAMKIRAMQ